MNNVTVKQFGIIEHSFEHTGVYDNPYLEATASVALTGPDGEMRTSALFWDGGATWRFRFSPDLVGEWRWETQSADSGLNGDRGSFEVGGSDLRGGITAMDGHPLHFQYQNGEPMWFVGDTAWAFVTDSEEKKHDRNAAEYHVDKRAAQGFNVIHSMMICEAGWGNTGGDAFDDLQAEKINPAYWQEVDERIAYANSKGITVGLVLAWGDKGPNPNDWREFPSQASRERYARYMATRYGAMNVYFILAGEWNADIRRGVSEEQARADYGAIGHAVLEADVHGRMIGIHPMIWGTAREFASEPWCTFGDYQQMYPHVHDEILKSLGTHMPVVNSEYAYYLRDSDEDGVCDKENSHDLDTIRHATWDIVMAGGYVITGWGNTYFGGCRNPKPFDLDAAEDDDWEAQIQKVIQFFKGLYWWKLKCNDDLITTSVERSDDGVREFSTPKGMRKHALPPSTAYWALEDSGMMYIGYVRGVTEGVTLRLGGGVFIVKQVNPRTGDATDLGEMYDAVSFLPPDEQDWVIVAERK